MYRSIFSHCAELWLTVLKSCNRSCSSIWILQNILFESTCTKSNCIIFFCSWAIFKLSKICFLGKPNFTWLVCWSKAKGLIYAQTDEMRTNDKTVEHNQPSLLPIALKYLKFLMLQLCTQLLHSKPAEVNGHRIE